MGSVGLVDSWKNGENGKNGKMGKNEGNWKWQKGGKKRQKLRLFGCYRDVIRTESCGGAVILFCFVFSDFYRFLPIFSRYFPGIFFVGRFFFPFFLIFFNFQISKFPFKLPNLQSSTTQNCLIFFSPKNQPSLAYPKRPLSESGTQNKHKRPKYAQNEQVAFFSPFFPTQKT